MRNLKIDEEYNKLHSMGFFNGKSCLQHSQSIKKIIEDTHSSTILDFGSGKGQQYTVDKLNLFWNAKVHCYDPYVKEYENLPNENFDGVICTDVLEHIEEDYIDSIFKEIKLRANKFIFLGICTRLAKKKFSDGTNVHLTVRSIDWWKNKLKADNIILKIEESK